MAAATHKIKNLEKLLAQGQRHRFAAKTTLIAAGERDETLSLILKGSATVVIEAEEGRELVIAYLNPGDFFGELGLFRSLSRDQAHNAWVRAKTECEVVQISYVAFRELAQHEPEMLYALGGQMAQRWRQGLSGTRPVVLVHGAMLMEDERESMAAAVNLFNERCGLEQRVQASSHIALHERHPAPELFDELEAVYTRLLSDLA